MSSDILKRLRALGVSDLNSKLAAERIEALEVALAAICDAYDYCTEDLSDRGLSALDAAIEAAHKALEGRGE
jgi:hypothetical protein